MTEGGFIKLHKKFLNWEWYRDVNVMRVFLHLLLIANWKDGRFMGKEIKRGSVAFGLESLAGELGLSVQALRTAITKLKSTGEITTQSTNKFTVVTLTKYEFYQGGSEEINKRTTNEQQTKGVQNNIQTTNKKFDVSPTESGSRDFEILKSTSKQHANNKREGSKLTTIEEVRIKNINTPSTLTSFDRFWSAYPRKVGKQAAFKAFKKVDVDIDVLLRALEAQKQSQQWTRDNGQYIPHPTTWLNQGRWEDEPTVISKPSDSIVFDDECKRLYGN